MIFLGLQVTSLNVQVTFFGPQVTSLVFKATILSSKQLFWISMQLFWASMQIFWASKCLFYTSMRPLYASWVTKKPQSNAHAVGEAVLTFKKCLPILSPFWAHIETTPFPEYIPQKIKKFCWDNRILSYEQVFHEKSWVVVIWHFREQSLLHSHFWNITERKMRFAPLVRKIDVVIIS